MSKELNRAMLALSASMNRNVARVNRKLKKAGVSSSDPLVFSIAKYYVALNKLAEEK
jgi:hypothetical protein